MSDKEKETKLNDILKKNEDKIDSNILKSIKMRKNTSDDSAILKRQKPQKQSKLVSSNTKIGEPRDERQLTSAPEFFKPKLEVKHNYEKSVGQLQNKFVNYKPYGKYNSEPLVKLEHVNPTDGYGYTADQAADGLHAADLGYPSTYNGKLVMLSTKHVKPDLYKNLAQSIELLPVGYRAALGINLEKQKQKEQSEQNRSSTRSDSIEQVDELKNKRKQITDDFNAMLRKIGNDMLKQYVGQLADDLTGGGYDDVENSVSSNLPARIDFMSPDMEAMQALVTGLNSTNKAALIIDQIYINAMLTMYLNDYNRKNIRETTFLLFPLNDEKAFTDSEGMFSSSHYFRKIGTIAGYNFAGVDFVYIDLTLMREYTYQILSYLIHQLTLVNSRNGNLSQIIVRTNIDLGIRTRLL